MQVISSVEGNLFRGRDKYSCCERAHASRGIATKANLNDS